MSGRIERSSGGKVAQFGNRRRFGRLASIRGTTPYVSPVENGRGNLLELMKMDGVYALPKKRAGGIILLHPTVLNHLVAEEYKEPAGDSLELIAEYAYGDRFIDPFDSHDDRREWRKKYQDSEYSVAFEELYMSRNQYSAANISAAIGAVGKLEYFLHRRDRALAKNLKHISDRLYRKVGIDPETNEIIGTPYIEMPPDEQDKIVDFCETECRKVLNLLVKKAASIST